MLQKIKINKTPKLLQCKPRARQRTALPERGGGQNQRKGVQKKAIGCVSPLNSPSFSPPRSSSSGCLPGGAGVEWHGRAPASLSSRKPAGEKEGGRLRLCLPGGSPSKLLPSGVGRRWALCLSPPGSACLLAKKGETERRSREVGGRPGLLCEEDARGVCAIEESALSCSEKGGLETERIK